MVLFLEAEVLRLLELYAALHQDPENVTPRGGSLRQHAIEKLTSALNASFPREQPWTETQVSVKFKNLRSEYAEFHWLSAQPGFKANGEGLTPDWWRGVQRLRPKSHAFKGKLPWPFEANMRQILGDDPPPRRKRRQQKQQQEPEVETVVHVRVEAEQQQQQEQQQEDEGEVPVEEEGAADALEQAASPPRLQHHKRKRAEDREAVDPATVWSRGFEAVERRGSGDYGRSLALSVEQSSGAAAGMARGFQDLVAMFQEEAARCRALEQQSTRDGRELPALADQRRVLLAIANSLEHSTRAAADMAKGYRDLVGAFVRAGGEQPRQQQGL
jgi:hypothetical protein